VRPPGATSAFDRSVIQQVLVSLVAIKIAGLVLIFDPAGLISFELPKSLFSRAMEWLVAGALLIALARYGLRIIPRSRLHVAVAAIVVVSALSTLFAENRYVALFGEENHYLGLTFVLDMALLYVAVAVAFRHREDWALLGGIMAFATTLVLAYAAIQYRGLDPLGWSVNARSSTFSTLGDADTLGRYFSLVFGASAGVAVAGRGRIPTGLRMLGAALALAVLGAAALSTVRGTFLGIAAVLFAVPFVYLRTRDSGRRARAMAAIGAVAIVAGLAGLLAFAPVGAKAQTVLRDPGTAIRLRLFDSAARAALDRPLLGYGPDNFAVAYPRYRRPDGTTVGVLDSDAHNWLFQTAATTGALGLLALVVAILMSLLTLWNGLTRRAGALGPALLLASIAYWTHAATTIASPGVDWFPYLAFGGVASMANRGADDPQRMRKRSAGALVLAAVIGVLAFSGSVGGVSAFLANRDGAVAAAGARARPERAVTAAGSALARDGGRAVYWYWLGRAEESQERWTAAAAAYAEAAARAPYERAYWARIAQSLTREATRTGAADARDAAIGAARRGTEVDPNDPSTHLALAETAYALGEYDLSLGAAIDAIRLWPGGDNDAPAARAAAHVADLPRARSLLEGVLRVRDSAPLHLALAQVALKQGDRETARREASRTLELAPGNTAAREVLSAAGK